MNKKSYIKKKTESFFINAFLESCEKSWAYSKLK